MRLKLKVQRNNLPDINLLWAAKEQDNGNKCTISSLLSEVNTSIPLESETWALDDYSVFLDDFECLHYNFISDILKDGDCVTIRPLSTADVRNRRKGGRTQITSAGFHVVDGVPFGRGPTERPPRPSVLIPSRKRRIAEVQDDGDEANGQLTVADIEEVEDLLASVNGGQMSIPGAGMNDDDAESSEPRAAKRRKVSHVRFNVVDEIEGFDVDEVEDEDEEDSEDDEDFIPEDDDESDADSEEEEHGPVQEAEQKAKAEAISYSTSDLSDSSSEVSSDSSSSFDSSSSLDSDVSKVSTSGKTDNLMTAHATELAQAHITPGTPPGQGKARTKKRNQRRINRKRLDAYKQQGLLPQEANIADMENWDRDHPEYVPYPTQRDNSAALETQLDGGATTNGTMNGTEPGASSGAFSEISKAAPSLLQRAKDLKSAISSAIVPYSNSSSPLKMNAKQQKVNQAERQQASSSSPPEIQSTKLDVAASRRTKLAGHPSDSVSEDEDPLSEAWRSRIEVLAVDCDDPSIKLSEPPYPFVQRWDPSQKRKHWSGGGKRKRNARRSYGYDGEDQEEEYNASYYDEEHWNGNGGDYGETEENGENGEHYEEDAAEQLLAEAEELMEDDFKDDLPPLPKDITTLPDLSKFDLSPGAVIAFKVLECTAATNWAPTISKHRTAEVGNSMNGENTITVKLAQRERTIVKAKFDTHGKRLYDKFEMNANDADDEDEEEIDDGERTLAFDEMLEPKLVRAAGEEDKSEVPT